jgi:hypothetical protein
MNAYRTEERSERFVFVPTCCAVKMEETVLKQADWLLAARTSWERVLEVRAVTVVLRKGFCCRSLFRLSPEACMLSPCSQFRFNIIYPCSDLLYYTWPTTSLATIHNSSKQTDRVDVIDMGSSTSDAQISEPTQPEAGGGGRQHQAWRGPWERRASEQQVYQLSRSAACRLAGYQTPL